MKFSRKYLTYVDLLWDAFCIASVAGIWPRFIEPKLLKKTHVKLPIPQLKKNLAGIKIVQFSDLHFSKDVSDRFLKKIEISIKEENPDILVFTGDFLCFSTLEDEKRMKIFFSNIPRSRYGNYAVLGNHDYNQFVSLGDLGNYSLIKNLEARSSLLRGFKRLLKPKTPTGIFDPDISSLQLHQPLLELISKTPFTLLHNSCQHVRIQDTSINIFGLGEYSAGQMHESEAHERTNPSDFTLTLLHNPDGALHLKYRSDLILSGHTHGGQINLPLLKTRFNLMEETKFCKGLIRFKDQWIYVSRGVGSVFPFRWFSPPEIVSITLESV